MKLLELVKANEQAESVYMVMSDPIAKVVASAWTIYKPSYQEKDVTEGMTPEEARRSSWSEVKIDAVRLAELANVPMLTTLVYFNRLKDSGLIYADGSLHSTLRNMMRAEIAQYVRGLSPRPIPPPQR